jgi:putative NIF3 family GTP cyclohydrolase 1 type 2
MRHHDVLGALRRGCAVMLAGHTNTERGYLPRLRDLLGTAMPECRFEISTTDRSPLRAV